MSRFCNTLSAFCFLIFMPVYSFAWNAVGHMLVANIAYQQLNASTRTKVDALVSTFNQEYPEITSLDQLATWPDSIRGQKIDAFTHWHYIDVPFADDGTPLPQNTIDTDNALWALKVCEAPVKNHQANRYERARFLGFVVHIVGDLHQPLHTVTHVSAIHPDGDKGGNLHPIHHNHAHNLHALWDSGVGTFVCQEPKSACVMRLAQELMARYPKSYFGARANDLDPTHWLDEGMTHAKTAVYTVEENRTPTSYYLFHGKDLAEQQVVLAGYRLAAILNQIVA